MPGEPQLLNRAAGPPMKTQAFAVVACIFFYAIAWLGIKTLTGLLLPASFQGTKTIALILLPSSLTVLLNFPWTVSFLLFAHPRILMAVDVVSFPVLLFLYWVAISGHGAAGAAVVTSGFALVKTAVFQLLARQTLQRDWSSVENDSGGLAVASAAG